MKRHPPQAQPSPASAVRAWRAGVILPTYAPAPPDPNPMFLEKRVYQGSSGRVYPLPVTDRIAERATPRLWQAIWLENEYLQVMLLPEIGGRIHRILDKPTHYDLIYYQPVIKPALVGLAGPWISGGIEFNWPQHHRPATFLPVDTVIERHQDGSVTVWCSDLDPQCRMKGMHGVCLHPGCAYVELKVRACNRTLFTQTFLWWANVATQVHEAYQSFFPPDVYYVADHARRSMSEYPLAQGRYYGVDYGARGRQGIPPQEVPAQFVPPHCTPPASQAPASGSPPIPLYAANDLSFYANIPVPTSYMCMGSREDFFGGYDYRAQAGIVHLANHHLSPGKKQWTWGNHAFGYAWDRNLTDPDAHGQYAPYIELMAGVYTDNQPDFSFLLPGETKAWSQYWYPIHQIGPAHHANLNAAVSLTLDRKRVRLGVAVTRAFPDAVIQLERADGSDRTEYRAQLAPGRPFIQELPQPRKPWTIGQTVLRVRDEDGQELIAYRPQPPTRGAVPPPATEPPAPREVASADELFLTGLHLDQYRHATRCPTLYWREALRRDPGDARCNHALGLWHLKRGEFAEAQTGFRQAIARLTRRNANPADGEPYYHLGLCLRFQADALDLAQDPAAQPLLEEAYAMFYKATWNHAWAGPAYQALAELDCRRHDWTKASRHLDRACARLASNVRAANLWAMVLQRQGNSLAAEAFPKLNQAVDPLDWWSRYLLGEKLTCDLQTLLDLALDLARAGFYREALALLNGRRPRPAASTPGPSAAGTARPEEPRAEIGDDPGLEGPATGAGPGDPRELGAAPMVHYYLGWLYGKLGDNRSALAAFKRAATTPPDYCFPARLEEIAILEAAMRANPQDAKAPYYLGNLLYDRRRHSEAIRLWQRSVKRDPSFSVAWRNLGIGSFNILRQPARARSAYDRAFRANPTDARLLYERDQLWKRLGIPPAQRLRELEKHPDLVARRDDLSVELGTLYNQAGRHRDALTLVRQRHFQPWEGGEGGPLGLWVRSHLALGREALGRAVAAEARPSAANAVTAQGFRESAVAHFREALGAPFNLGEARHLLANASDVHYWLGCALAQRGEAEPAQQHWLAAATFAGDFQAMSVRPYSEMTYYSALAWERLGQTAKATALLRGLLRYAQKLQQSAAKIDYFATSLPTLLLFEEDLQFRQETTARFLQAQALLGLGRRAQGAALLRTVLRRDPNHALAADLAESLS